MDWRECIKKSLIKEIKKDDNLIISLSKSSKNKLICSNMLELNEKTAISKISLAYDSLRELLEALSLKKGYKIYNHECYTTFLKEILNENSKAEEFDNLRKIRNAINYYGKDVSIQNTKNILNRIKKLKKQIKNLINTKD